MFSQEHIEAWERLMARRLPDERPNRRPDVPAGAPLRRCPGCGQHCMKVRACASVRLQRSALHEGEGVCFSAPAEVSTV